MKQPGLGLREAGTNYSRIPTQQKSPQQKLNAKKTQHSGSDKKPSVLEIRTAKTNSTESAHGSVSDYRIPLVKVGVLPLMAGRTYG